jgi:hypothetical protein
MVRFLFATLALLAMAGCGGRPEKPQEEDSLIVEQLDREDTTGLSAGRPLLQDLDIFRDPAGAIRARGRLDLPDRTRLQLLVYRPKDAVPLTRTQFEVRDGSFESPPLLGADGPLAQGLYRFQLVSHFDPVWQPAEVLAATEQGRALKGPGMIRDRQGRAAFVHDEELRR